ncbi:MAG: dihydrodipicolinate synthase family protein [Granulosicoccus sp.]
MASLINRNSEGVFIIAATPFSDQGVLDFDSTNRLIDFYLDSGVSGITILGIMGEAPKLDQAESIQFARAVMQRVNSRIPVVVGVSGAGLGNLSTLAATVMDMGAAGVMVSPLQGLNTEVKLFDYYTEVSRALGQHVPICLQDYPQASGVHISVDTILSITAQLPQVVMLKHEDWPGLGKLARVRHESNTDRVPRISILTGNGGLFLPQELHRGADGAMTGFAYPEMLVNVVAMHKAGRVDEAEDLFDKYLPLVRYEQQPGFGLAVRKEILRRRGVIQSAAVRAPGPRLSAEDHAELSRLITRLEYKLEGGH